MKRKMMRRFFCSIVVMAISLTFAGCGGGGGGGSTPATPATNEDMRVTLDSISDATLARGEEKRFQAIIRNWRSIPVDESMKITLSSNNLQFVADSAEVYTYASDGQTTSAPRRVANDITSDMTSIGTLPARLPASVFFKIKPKTNATAGDYTVTVEIQGGGVPSDSKTFTITVSGGGSGGDAKATCTFGGTIYAHGSTRTEAGCATMTYRCNDGVWEVVSGSTACTPNQDPTITLATATPASGVAPLTVNFTASASDPDGDAVSYSWTSGNGGSGTGASFSRTYTTAGTYYATLTVSDGRGGTATRNFAITVTNPVPTGTVTVRTLGIAGGWANIAVTCGGQRIAGAVNDLGGGYYGYSATIAAGTCTLDPSTYPVTVGTKVLVPAKSTTSGELTEGGTRILTLVYEEDQTGLPDFDQPNN